MRQSVTEGEGGDRDVTHLKTITQEIGKASSRFE